MPNKNRDIKGIATMATTPDLFPLLLQTYDMGSVSFQPLHSTLSLFASYLFVWMEVGWPGLPLLNIILMLIKSHKQLCDGLVCLMSHPNLPSPCCTCLSLSRCLSSDWLLNSFSGAPFYPHSHSWCFSLCYSIHNKSFTSVSSILVFEQMLLCQAV